MNSTLFSELVNKFDIRLNINDIIAFGNGHINDTYLVKTLSSFFVQVYGM